MKRLYALAGLVAIATPLALSAASRAAGDTPTPDASPIYGVTLPDGYRSWKLIAPAIEAAPLDELRVVVGNETALDTYRSGTLPFPDGTVLVKPPGSRSPRPNSGRRRFRARRRPCR